MRGTGADGGGGRRAWRHGTPGSIDTALQRAPRAAGGTPQEAAPSLAHPRFQASTLRGTHGGGVSCEDAALCLCSAETKDVGEPRLFCSRLEWEGAIGKVWG